MGSQSEQQGIAWGLVFSIFWRLFSLPVLLVAILLILIATTTAGRLFAIAVLLLLPIPLNFLHWENRIRRLLTAIFAGGSVVCIVTCIMMRPGYVDDPDANARVVYLEGTSHHRLSPSHLVPELDQQLLGSHLFAFIDLGWKQAGALRDDVREVYKAKNDDPELNKLPSTLGFAYREMLTGSRKRGPLFVYRPPDKEPLPVILFLHGSMGNFQGYWQIWKEFAEIHRVAIVAPTFGAGNWSKSGGLECIEETTKYIREHPGLDGDRIILAGLSNGATGVTPAAINTPKNYLALIYLSPVLNEDDITWDFTQAFAGRPVLIVTGEKDRRTPAKHIREAATRMSLAKIAVEGHFVPGQDHFLVFDDWPHVSNIIGFWLHSKVLATPQSSPAEPDSDRSDTTSAIQQKQLWDVPPAEQKILLAIQVSESSQP